MKKKGFTLVELLAVIAILAILVILVLPNLVGMFNDAKKKALVIDAQSLARESEELYLNKIVSGKKIKEVSSDGEDQISNNATKNKEYSIELDNRGRVKHMTISDGTYCIDKEGEYEQITVEDVFECDLDTSNFAKKIIADNNTKSDGSIDLSKASYIVTSYVPVKTAGTSTYQFTEGSGYCFANDYIYTNNNYYLKGSTCLTYTSSTTGNYKYFCENDTYCRTMREIKNETISSSVAAYTHYSSPNSAIENGRGFYRTTRERGQYYYFRGNVTNNYVSFAGQTWRIVKIYKDESVRLMLAGDAGSSAYGTLSGIANTGYMYGNNDTSYENVTSNYSNSTIKTKIDVFYENTFLGKEYENYLADEGFCSDRSLASDYGYSLVNIRTGKEIDNYFYHLIYERMQNNSQNMNISALEDTGLGYGKNTTLFGAMYRAFYNTPTYDCKRSNDLFTAVNNSGNKKLTYPIGLISSDEAIYAGA